MSYYPRALLQLTAVLALAANACATHGVGSVESPAAKLSCEGGTIATASDAAFYGACVHVNGDLRISAPELADLSALAGLRSVSGKLEIAGNPQLDDLSGLEQLERVGSLSIQDNAELDDLSGLEQLRWASEVVIRRNAELGTLHGLEGLTQLDTLVVEHNGLYRTTGLSNLTHVGDLVVANNARLNSLQGLSSLSHARSVQIHNNPRLCARGMLPALAHVDGQVSLSANRGLSMPDVHQLLGRIEHDLAGPNTETVARLQASLR